MEYQQFEFSRERVASVATNARQSKGKLHGIFSTSAFTPHSSFKQRLKRNFIERRIRTEFANTLCDKDDSDFHKNNIYKLGSSRKTSFQRRIQEIKSSSAFRYFIGIYNDSDSIIPSKLIPDMESLRELIQERAKHKQEYDRRMNDRMMQSKEGNAYSSKTLDAGLVVTESNKTETERHVLSSRSGKDTHAEDADINSMNDKQPMAEVKRTVEQ
ncbi:hypothetical protein Tco_0613064 [Tanacetum coccineum]